MEQVGRLWDVTNSDRQNDGLIITDAVRFQFKRGKILYNIYYFATKKCSFSKTIWKNVRSPMEKGRVEFSITFQQPGWDSEQIGNVQIFFYIN